MTTEPGGIEAVRRALAATRAAAAAEQQAKPKRRRTVPVVRRGGEPLGLGTAIASMMSERGLAVPADGDIPAPHSTLAQAGPATGADAPHALPDAADEPVGMPEAASDGYLRALAAHRQAAPPAPVDGSVAAAIERQQRAMRRLSELAFPTSGQDRRVAGASLPDCVEPD